MEAVSSVTTNPTHTICALEQRLLSRLLGWGVGGHHFFLRPQASTDLLLKYVGTLGAVPKGTIGIPSYFV